MSQLSVVQISNDGSRDVVIAQMVEAINMLLSDSAEKSGRLKQLRKSSLALESRLGALESTVSVSPSTPADSHATLKLLHEEVQTVGAEASATSRRVCLLERHLQGYDAGSTSAKDAIQESPSEDSILGTIARMDSAIADLRAATSDVSVRLDGAVSLCRGRHSAGSAGSADTPPLSSPFAKDVSLTACDFHSPGVVLADAGPARAGAESYMARLAARIDHLESEAVRRYAVIEACQGALELLDGDLRAARRIGGTLEGIALRVDDLSGKTDGVQERLSAHCGKLSTVEVSMKELEKLSKLFAEENRIRAAAADDSLAAVVATMDSLQLLLRGEAADTGDHVGDDSQGSRLFGASSSPPRAGTPVVSGAVLPAIKALEARLDSIQGDIATAAADKSNNDTRIDLTDAALDSVKSNVEALMTRVVKVEQSVVGPIGSAMTAISGRCAGLSAQVEALTASLSGRLDAVDVDLDLVKQRVASDHRTATSAISAATSHCSSNTASLESEVMAKIDEATRSLRSAITDIEKRFLNGEGVGGPSAAQSALQVQSARHEASKAAMEAAGARESLLRLTEELSDTRATLRREMESTVNLLKISLAESTARIESTQNGLASLGSSLEGTVSELRDTIASLTVKVKTALVEATRAVDRSIGTESDVASSSVAMREKIAALNAKLLVRDIASARHGQIPLEGVDGGDAVADLTSLWEIVLALKTDVYGHGSPVPLVHSVPSRIQSANDVPSPASQVLSDPVSPRVDSALQTSACVADPPVSDRVSRGRPSLVAGALVERLARLESTIFKSERQKGKIASDVERSRELAETAIELVRRSQDAVVTTVSSMVQEIANNVKIIQAEVLPPVATSADTCLVRAVASLQQGFLMLAGINEPNSCENTVSLPDTVSGHTAPDDLLPPPPAFYCLDPSTHMKSYAPISLTLIERAKEMIRSHGVVTQDPSSPGHISSPRNSFQMPDNSPKDMADVCRVVDALKNTLSAMANAQESTFRRLSDDISRVDRRVSEARPTVHAVVTDSVQQKEDERLNEGLNMISTAVESLASRIAAIYTFTGLDDQVMEPPRGPGALSASVMLPPAFLAWTFCSQKIAPKGGVNEYGVASSYLSDTFDTDRIIPDTPSLSLEVRLSQLEQSHRMTCAAVGNTVELVADEIQVLKKSVGSHVESLLAPLGERVNTFEAKISALIDTVVDLERHVALNGEAPVARVAPEIGQSAMVALIDTMSLRLEALFESMQVLDGRVTQLNKESSQSRTVLTTEQRADRRAGAENLAQRSQRVILQRYYHYWLRLRAEKRAALKSIAENISQRARLRPLSVAFRRWRRELQLKRAGLQDFAHRCGKLNSRRLMLTVFQQWRRGVQACNSRNQIVISEINSHRRQTLLRESWAKWRLRCMILQSNRFRAARHDARESMRSVFHKWQQVTRRVRIRESLLALIKEQRAEYETLVGRNVAFVKHTESSFASLEQELQRLCRVVEGESAASAESRLEILENCIVSMTETLSKHTTSLTDANTNIEALKTVLRLQQEKTSATFSPSPPSCDHRVGSHLGEVLARMERKLPQEERQMHSASLLSS